MRGLQKFNDLWTLDTDTWEWAPVELLQNAARPSPRDFAAMVDLPAGKLLLFGGLDASEKRLDDTWIFDSITSIWTEVKQDRSRPKPRYAHSLARMDSRVFLFGGETNTGLVADLWTLRGATTDIEEGVVAWIPLDLPGSTPAPRKGAAMAGLNSWLVVMGGRTAELGWFRTRTDTFHNDVALVDCEAGSAPQWRVPPVVGEAPQPRELHTLAALSGGRLLLFGGGNGKQIFGDAWWLEPESMSGAASAFPAELAPTAQLSGFAGGTGTPLSAVSVDGTFDNVAHSSSMQDGDSVEAAQAAAIASAAASAPARDIGASSSTPSARWWEGTQEADRFTRLRSRLGLPPDTSTGAALSPGANSVLDPQGTHELAHLNIWQDGSSLALRIKDVAPLLHEYHQLRPLGLAKATLEQGSLAAGPALWQNFALQAESVGRYNHYRPQDLRVGDVTGLQAEFWQMSVPQRSGNGHSFL
ncbi:g4371 [Coccomyxa elongata]